MLRLVQERESLNVIDDQIGTPTPARWIAEMCLLSVLKLDNGEGLEGVFNLTPNGQTSWHGFAQAIARHAASLGIEVKARPEDINPIPTTEYPTPAARPANSRLSKNKIATKFGWVLPDWENFVPLVLEELVEA